MSKIVSVHACDDYKLLIDFEDGSSINYNMQKLVGTLPYLRLKDPKCFQGVRFNEKYIFWEPADGKQEIFSLRLSVDNILFSLRD